jgi:hypothetical protein
VYGSRIRRVSAAVFTLIVVACGRSDRAPVADSIGVTPRAARPMSVPHSRRYPGALTKPIDAYSGDELYDLTRGLTYAGSHSRDRRCRNAPGCEGISPIRRTAVQVSAVATQDSLSAGDVPAFGVIAVQAINGGDAEEARYGMRPGATLRYYAIVQGDSTGGLRWRLEELQTAVPRRHVQVAAGRVQGCGHAWTAGARADFRSCTSADRPDSVETPAIRLQKLDDPIWQACDMGCCALVP